MERRPTQLRLVIKCSYRDNDAVRWQTPGRIGNGWLGSRRDCRSDRCRAPGADCRGTTTAHAGTDRGWHWRGDLDAAADRAATGTREGNANWSAFVNNHAWALVRLQECYRIRKVSRGHYALEPDIIVKPGTAISAVQQNGSLAQWAENLRRRANSVNRASGFSAAITATDMIQLWDRCDGACSLTGLRFTGTIVGTGQTKRAFAPSLDRIDPEGPYSLDNCRLVLAAVNFALNRFGIETFDQIVVGRARTRRWLRRDALRRTPKERAAPSDPLQG